MLNLSKFKYHVSMVVKNDSQKVNISLRIRNYSAKIK